MTVREAPVARFLMLTVTPGVAVPLSSTITPLTLAVAVWAWAEEAASHPAMASMDRGNTQRLMVFQATRPA